MPVGGAETIAGLQRSNYIYHGDDGVVYSVPMRDAYAAENQMGLGGATGAPPVPGVKARETRRHVWLPAPAPSVTNHATKTVRRKMTFDTPTFNYLAAHAIGSLTATAIDGIYFQIEGHVGEKIRAV